MYDAIVVGARCAGSPTAMLLARRGHRVLLVDRATFPSDVPRAHFIQPAGASRLERWGLLDRVLASNCPRVTTWRAADGTLAGTPPPALAAGTVGGCAPRRYVLDELVARAAVEAGAELREAFSVRELLTDGDRVTGIRGGTRGGATVTERARIVIGADGMRSLVARAVRADVYDVRPPATCVYYSYWSDVPSKGIETFERPGRSVIAVGTNDGLTLVYAAWPAAEFPAVRAGVEPAFLAAVDGFPDLAERMRSGRRAERWYGTADLPNFFRRPFGPGWALVGDAGYHKDPLLAQGILDAYRDAELLAEAVDAGLTGRRPLAEALADYERLRNEAARPLYDLNHERALLGPPDERALRLVAALRGNREETDRYFGVVAGTVPLTDFYAPERIARILAG